MRRAALGLFVVGAVLGVADEARANPLDTHGFGSRETAMGSAQVGDTTGFAAVFYNPASLARAPGLSLSLGYFRVDQHLSINGKDSGVDPVKGLVGGVVAPGTLFGVPFAFGLATHLPDDRISRVRTMKQEIPRWEIYDNRGQILFIASVIAIRPVKWLSIGGGIAYLSSTRGDFGIEGSADIKEPSDSQLRHEVDADLTSVRIPMLGARVEAHEKVSVGLSYRGEAKLDLQIGADVHGKVEPFGAPVRYTLASRSFDAFHPRQITLGTSYRAKPWLTANLDLVWVEWSAYKSATSQTSTHLELPADVRSVVAVPPDPKPTVVRDPAFSNRIVPHLGIEGRPVSGKVDVFVRGGYVFEKTPVPPQTGQTNFVDADRHTISAGVGAAWNAPFAELPGKLALDAHFAWSILPTRDTKKDGPADFVGSYSQSGNQRNVGVTFGVFF